MGGFNNPIIGGGGALVYPSIHSPDFVTEVSGWTVNKDGSAEFDDIVIRDGQIVSGKALYYSGTPALGNLIASISPSMTTDGLGNTVFGGVTTIDPSTGLVTELFGGKVFLFSESVPGLATIKFDDTNGGLDLSVGSGGIVTISPAAGTTATAFDVEGSTNGAGQLVLIKNTPAANGDHALTVNHTGTGTDNTVAVNVTSNSDLSSSMYVTGQATERGVLKISHNPGKADGSDANCSLLALDTGSTAGTAAQGIALISSTSTTGNLILMRNNSRDDFVVKGSGRVGIGVVSGATPAGVLQLVQNDTSTFGLAMTAVAAGADMINLKDSGGSQRFQIGNAGNLTARATAFFTSPVMFGSASSDTGGGGGGVIMLAHNTDPTSNPAPGHVLLYCDPSGNLLARTSAGNVRTVAAV